MMRRRKNIKNLRKQKILHTNLGLELNSFGMTGNSKYKNSFLLWIQYFQIESFIPKKIKIGFIIWVSNWLTHKLGEVSSCK
jgi:hypothetical protein